jgi:hypothetical protein
MMVLMMWRRWAALTGSHDDAYDAISIHTTTVNSVCIQRKKEAEKEAQKVTETETQTQTETQRDRQRRRDTMTPRQRQEAEAAAEAAEALVESSTVTKYYK